MSQLISVPCKKGYELKFTEVVSAYVKEVYGEDQCNSHVDAFNEFGNMRSKMLNKLFDKHESTLNVLTRYIDQLVALENKIPIEENAVRIDFKWDDAFSKDSLFGKKGSLKIASGNYERICVLFNIAAVYSQIAETSNLYDDATLKTSAKYLQQAAGIFSFLKSDVPNIIHREPTIDLNSDTLSTLSVLMLAQAQELIYTKSVRDSHKDGNIAKIAQQTADLYADTLKLMQLNSVKSIWPKDWIPIVAGKQAGYHAMAEYYQAKACATNQEFGQQIARFKKSMELMKTSVTRAGAKFMFRSEQEKMKRELETAEKENNVIYHDKVPDVSTLSPVPKAVVAREIYIENPMNKDFKDLFDKIVPLGIHSALSVFKNKRSSKINAEIYRLKEATNTLSGIMASLNLPGMLDDSTDNEVPSVILANAAIIRQEGGIEKIEELLNALPDVMSRNREIMAESIKLLDDEEESDKKLREQFKERWNRTPSGRLTEGWRGEHQKFESLLKGASDSDKIIHKLYQDHCVQIRILSQDEASIKANIPKSSHFAGSADVSNKSKGELRMLCNEVDKLKESRVDLIKEIENLESNSNMNSVFIKAITEDPALDQERFSEEEMNKMLIPIREKVRESMNMQEKLVEQLQEKTSHWNNKGSDGENRAAVISSLMLAFDKFSQLKTNLNEGLKFYADFTEILLRFQNKVKDFTFARKTEKDELMKDLQTSIVQERTETNPSRNFQATSGGTEAVQNPSQTNPPNRPLPTYQNQPQPLGAVTAPPAVAVSPNQPPGGLPYPPNPYSMPTPYMPGMPYPYPFPPPVSGQMPQCPPGSGFSYPTGYNPYNPSFNPGYNPYYPR